MNERHLVTEGFAGYELLDSGDHEKLERFGDYKLRRPDTQAIWAKSAPETWSDAAAAFVQEGSKGVWKKTTTLPESWPLGYDDVSFLAKLTNSKHVGLFPEQEPNWSWAKERIAALEAPQVLNLFGYTGAASVAAAKAGAIVTHVDSSKSSVEWAKENAERSGITEGAIRYIVEDARSFAKRELRREAKYAGILLDPPAFGRGAKDEVWKIEEDLLPLMEILKGLLLDAPGSFLLLNGYAAGYAPRSFAQLMQSIFPTASLEFGELQIKGADGRLLPCGMYVRFVQN